MEREIREVILHKIRIEHWAVKRDQIRLRQKCAVQGSDVAVADEDLWMTADNAVIEQSEQSRCSVTAAHAENSLDRAIIEHRHQVACPLAVTAGEKTPALP